jgi:hypothetical protein
LGLTFELIQVFVSGEERVLNCILCISRVAQLSIGAPVEPRQVARENILHFAGSILANTHIHVSFASDCFRRLHVVLVLQVRHWKSTPPSNQANGDLPVCFQRDKSSEV